MMRQPSEPKRPRLFQLEELSSTCPKKQFTDPKHYLCPDGLVHAVNVALILNQPLLLTGEPGSGKTQLAFWLAHELKLGKPLVFETKSTSLAQDLFYTYDTISRFHAANTQKDPIDERDYITFQALGKAILYANSKDDIQKILPTSEYHPGQPQKSVVLIDEIDKAPRDFPNDILNEIEQMFFKIPQMENRKVEASLDKKPIVIITSNSEKQLPAPFLRRCVFHCIDFPDKGRMEEIVQERFKNIDELNDSPKKNFYNPNDQLIKKAKKIFNELLTKEMLIKKPSTSEYLDWIKAIIDMQAKVKNMSDADILKNTLGVIVKNDEDLREAKKIVQECMK